MSELASKNPVIEKFQEYEEFFRANSGVIREYLFNRINSRSPEFTC